MSDLMRTLYAFVMEHRMGGVWDDAEYRSFSSRAQLQEDKLRALLDQEGRQILDDLLGELRLQNNVEMETLFRATVGLCRELNGVLTA